jgi:GTPase SAR1 family protein
MKVSRKTAEALSNHLHKDTHKIPWVLMLGEKGSGKTTCLYYLLSSTRDKEFPDTPVNWVDINYGREWFKLIDLGQDMIQDQEMVNFFISLADGFVYVFNGESIEKLKESIERFNKIIKKIPPNLPLLILINKRNPDFNVAINDIMDYFDLSLIASPNDPRSFHFEIVSFLTGDGVYRAFDWFVSQLLAYEGYEETITIHRVIIYDVNGLLQYDGQFSHAIKLKSK